MPLFCAAFGQYYKCTYSSCTTPLLDLSVFLKQVEKELYVYHRSSYNLVSKFWKSRAFMTRRKKLLNDSSDQTFSITGLTHPLIYTAWEYHKGKKYYILSTYIISLNSGRLVIHYMLCVRVAHPVKKEALQREREKHASSSIKSIA